jgi:hypothetical protein
VNGYPFTIFIRGASTSLTATQCLLSFIQNFGPSYTGTAIFFSGATGGDPVQFSKYGAATASSAAGYGSGVWSSAIGRSRSNTDFDINLDGVTTTGPTTNVAAVATQDVNIGGRFTPSITNPFAGAGACAAVWSASLTDAECVSLHKGFSPQRIRPQSLTFYAPLLRELSMLRNSTTNPPGSLTATNSPTVTAHPRTYGL